MIKSLITTILAASFFVIHAGAAYADNSGIATKIIDGIKPNPYHPDQRLTDEWDSLLKAMKKNGIISNKPTVRADYTDYYRLNSPLRLFEHDVVVFEHEYPQTYIGCCVSAGIGLVLKVNGGIQNLKNIAISNKCNLDYPMNTDEYLVKLKTNVTSGYASLSCRERDLTAGE